jgi:hypothetical protein
METNLRAVAHKAFVPPSHARAHAEAQRAPSGTAEAKPFSRIVVPISMPASKLPPSLTNETMALDITEIFVLKLSMSLSSNGPVTVTRVYSVDGTKLTSITAL